MPRIASQCLALIVSVAFALNLTATGPLPPDTIGASPRAPGRVDRAFTTLPQQRPAAGSFTVALPIGPSIRGVDLAPQLAAAPSPPIVNLAGPRGSLTLPAPPRISGNGPPMPGTLVAQTERLDIYVGIHTFSPEQVAEVAPLLEELLRLNEERFGTTLDRRISLAFYRTARAPDSDTRGIAYTEEGRAEVFYQPHGSIDRAVMVAAHELAHHLQARRYGPVVQKRADLLLLEGQATWITGRLWLARYRAASWRERARQIEANGCPLRLLQITGYGTNNAYELWASFFDFLVERYGMEKLDELYRSSASREPGSADYQGVLGKPLEELADEWRAWVRG
ncbi:MAG: hypothetical protein DIU80_001895 [Chloroflexota bacterium]